MKNILKLLVWQRDNENLKLDFSALSRLIPFAAVVESAILYRDKVYLSNALDDFVSYVSTALSMQFEKFLKADPEEIRKRMQEALSNGEQGAYDAGMAAQAWIDIITSLKSDYGRVFNTQTPTISMWEAVQKNKFIFVTLPTMASDTTPKQLGKLMMLKESFLTRQKKQIEQDLSEDNERFNVLVEAMSEVVKEYMDKKT